MAWNTKIPHLRRFVLQNFPFIEEDFDALTDYQLICKVVEFLNTVITSQNAVIQQMINVTADFEQLESLFNQLKDYVDHYFDTLDVQEEVNNKIDAMAEDGTLESIIGEYLRTKTNWVFDTILDMKNSENLVDGSYAETCGYYQLNDGGSGKYKIRTKTSEDIVDDNKIVAITDNLVAELINPSEVSTKLCVNLRLDNQSISNAKANIDTYKYMGVTDAVIIIHFDGDSCTVREDLDDFNEVIAYAISKNINIDTVKYHCTNPLLKTSDSFRDLYKAHCIDVIDDLEGVTITKLVVMNELNSMFNSFATQDDANKCMNMVNYFKNLGYKVSISVAGLEYFLDCYYSHPEVTDTFDFLAINTYPIIGDNKNLTSDEEVKKVYEEYYNFAKTIKSLYPTKDLVISEIGVQNVWESLSNPSNYLIEEMTGVTNSYGKVIPVFFGGLLNDNRMNELFSGIWLWYSEYYNSYLKETKIFRNKFVGGTN